MAISSAEMANMARIIRGADSDAIQLVLEVIGNAEGLDEGQLYKLYFLMNHYRPFGKIAHKEGREVAWGLHEKIKNAILTHEPWIDV